MVASISLDAEADQALYGTLKVRGGYGRSDEIVAIAIVRLINAVIRHRVEPVSHTEARRMIIAARDRLVARGEIEEKDGEIRGLAGEAAESQE